MENQRSRFARPVTAKQLAAIIWLPIILGGLAWFFFTSAQSAQKETEDRNRATAASMQESIRACRQLRKDLAGLPSSPGEAPPKAPDCDQLERGFADIAAANPQ